jgi:hypothetical protein
MSIRDENDRGQSNAAIGWYPTDRILLPDLFCPAAESFWKLRRWVLEVLYGFSGCNLLQKHGKLRMFVWRDRK